MQAAPARRIICAPAAETSREVSILQQHGFAVRVSGTAISDVMLPVRGGVLSFLLWNGSDATRKLVERAATAVRASRRCTVLWTGAIDDSRAVEELQGAAPAGVTVLRCETHDEAAEHVLACAQRASEDGGASTGPMSAEEEADIVDGVSAHLATAWGVSKHEADFLLSTVPLTQLARVRDDEGFFRLVDAQAGLVKQDLLFSAIEWLQRDQPQL